MLLAVLQYRSVEAVSTATAEQMHASLRGSLFDVRQSLDRELRLLCRELQLPREVSRQDDLGLYAAGFDRWRSVALHPTLVETVYVWQEDREGDGQMLQLDPSGTNFTLVASPENLTKLEERLAELPARFGAANEPDRSTHPAEHRDLRPLERPGRSASWMIDQNVAVLVHLIPAFPVQGSETKKPASRRWLVIVLNRNVLEQHILPELIQRYFGANQQSSYEVAVIDRNGHAPALYTSDPNLQNPNKVVPDEALNFFGRPTFSMLAEHASREQASRDQATRDQAARTAMFGARTGSAQTGGGEQPGAPAGFSEDHEEGPPSLAIEPIRYGGLGQEWEIIAKDRQGSVEAAVAALSRRNLMFNFAVLLVLGATMAMIVAASGRARRFARLQMDFVANVSHELRTPLTGIVSAAQNMADGLVDDKQKVVLYGKAIAGEAHQLSELMEQILQFSAIQQNGDRYHFQPVDVAEVVQFSLKNTSTLIQSAEIKVDQQLQAGLPPVSADFKALSRCLQNLIGNAVKYGGDERWIGIKAWMTNDLNGTNEICISVADKGIGIRREDLEHIFEPFYRGGDVTEAQIHGSGLGLPMAKRIVEAMGGRLTVESELGKGSTFTVHLPGEIGRSF